MFFPSVLMEGSYSQTGPVNVCYCLRKAKWLLYSSLRSHLNVLSTDEMKKRGNRGKMCYRGRGGRKWYEVEDEREVEAVVSEVN